MTTPGAPYEPRGLSVIMYVWNQLLPDEVWSAGSEAPASFAS